MKINDIIKVVEEIAPPYIAEKWDNVGFLVGDRYLEVKRVLIALEVTDEVIEEAISEKVQLIISHHPLIFKNITTITTDNAVEGRVVKLIKNDIALYSAHTNLDSAEGGTTDALCDVLDIKIESVLLPNKNDENVGIGRIGFIEHEQSVETFLKKLKNTGKFDFILYALDSQGLEKKIKKFGICAGSIDFDMIYEAKAKNCDIFISGDLKHHFAQCAKDIEMTIIDVGHYCGENLVVESLKNNLETRVSNIDFITSKIDAQIINVY